MTEFFSLCHRVQTASGAHPSTYPMVKWLGREADHSHPAPIEVKNAWSCASTPPVRLNIVVLN